MPQPTLTSDQGNKQAVLAVILVSYVMIVLDISVVLTGLPRIQHDLGFSETGLAWVQSAYTLTFGGLLLLGARAGDILGRRRMFVAGMVLFTLASIAIGISPSAGWMLAWRAIQGIGSAILAPSTLALLQTNFDEGPERTRAVSLYSAAAGVSATMGLVFGGILADELSWRVGFFINLPIGVSLVVAAYRFIPETSRRRGGFDLPGALASTVGMSALVYGFIRSAEAGWSDPLTLATLALAAVLIIAFAVIERRARQPILPLRLFTSRERSGAYAARVLVLGAGVGFYFFTTLNLQEIMGYGPALTGLAFVPATVLHVPFAIATPRLIRRFGSGVVLVTGLVVGIVGMAWLSRASAESSYLVSIALPMLLIGLSQGLTLSPLTTSGVAGVAHTDAGAASGAVSVAHQMGSSVGLSILVAVAGLGAGPLVGRALLEHRVETALGGAAAMLTFALVIALSTIVRPSRWTAAAPRTSANPDLASAEESTFGVAAVEAIEGTRA